ncbi:MAG: hypothetical protein HYR91_14745 [Flavobacteriia bacterium]|nr:hypothetical protein [Flavobacteriia bacterium]
MKNTFFLKNTFCLLSFIFIIVSCGNNDIKNENPITSSKESSENTIVGKWKLIQEKSDGSSDVMLHIEKSGYFEVNTVLNDPKFAKAGIDKIQPISKGQWKIENGVLILNHINQDQIKKEDFEIIKCDSENLKIQNKNKNIHSYIPYIEK